MSAVDVLLATVPLDHIAARLGVDRATAAAQAASTSAACCGRP